MPDADANAANAAISGNPCLGNDQHIRGTLRVEWCAPVHERIGIRVDQRCPLV